MVVAAILAARAASTARDTSTGEKASALMFLEFSVTGGAVSLLVIPPSDAVPHGLKPRRHGSPATVRAGTLLGWGPFISLSLPLRSTWTTRWMLC